MRHYEVVAVIHPEQQMRVTAMLDLYKKIVTDGGGVLHRVEDWGRRLLAYPIQNQHKGCYVMMNIECGIETLDKLYETLRFSDSIMRSLVIRRETALVEPSIMMKENKASREEGVSESNDENLELTTPTKNESDKPVAVADDANDNATKEDNNA